MTDKIVTSKGNVMTASEFQEWQRKTWDEQKRERNRKYDAIRSLYWDYMNQECDDEAARKNLHEVNGFPTKSINVALNTGRMNAKATVEFSAKALSLQHREEEALNDEIKTINGLIQEALDAPVTDKFVLKGRTTSRGDEDEYLPRNEYILRLEQRKRKAIKDTMDSLKVLKNENTQLNVVITDSEKEAQWRKGAEKFGLEIKVEQKDDID